MNTWKKFCKYGHFGASYILSAANYWAPPVDIRRVAKVLDIKVTESPDIDGPYSVSVSPEGAAEVVLKGAEPESRKRYSIAQAIGRIILTAHSPDGTVYDDDVDMYADGLLMPIRMIKSLKGYSHLQMKDIFFVPQDVMYERWCRTHHMK